MKKLLIKDGCVGAFVLCGDDADLVGELLGNLDRDRRSVSDTLGAARVFGESGFDIGIAPSRSWTSAEWAWITRARPSVSIIA